MNTYVIIDVETTETTPSGRIIEVGIVVIENDEEVKRFCTLIHPQTSIPPFISSLTNIYDEDVKDAPLFSDVADEIRAIINDHIIVGHNVLTDIYLLNKEFSMIGMNELQNMFIDTLELSKILFPTLLRYNLNDLAKQLHFTHDSPHRALSDAIVTSKLFLTLKEKLFNLPLQTKRQLIKLESNFQSHLENMLIKAKRYKSKQSNIITYRNLSFRDVFQFNEKFTQKIEKPFGPLIEDLYQLDGKLSNYSDKYEYHPNDVKVAELIYDAFQLNRHVLLEAEEKIGKRIAYLIAAIYEAVKENESIIVSTDKIEAQSKLCENELHLLKHLLPFQFTYFSLRGKSHYLSLQKLNDCLQTNEEHYNKNILKAMLLIWITETETGDINELHLTCDMLKYVKELSAESEHNNSSWSPYSYYKNAFKKAENSHIVVVNHALLTVDLHLQYQLIPPYQKVIIDEAHRFVEIAKKQSSLFIHFENVFHIIKKLKRYNNDLYMSLYSALFELYQFIYHSLLKVDDKVVVNDKHYRNKWPILVDMFHRIAMMFEKFMHYKNDKFPSEEVVKLEKQFQKLSQLTAVKQYVITFERKKRGGQLNVFLYLEHIDIPSRLTQSLLNDKKSVIFTSHALTVNNSFSYVIDQLKLHDHNIMENMFASPFDVSKQIELMVPTDIPSVNDEEFVFVVSELIYSLAHVINRNIAIIFPSQKMLQTVYYLLDEVIGLQYNLVAQNITNQKNTHLLKELQMNDNNIVLSTNMGLEQTDYTNKNISCFILMRLPFEHPNEIRHKLKRQTLEAEGINSFYHFTLPEMIIRLKQELGKIVQLIDNDGMIFLLDNRLISSSYQKDVITSIRQYPLTQDTTKSLIIKAKKHFQKKTDT